MTAGLVALRGLVLKELRQIRADPRMIPVLVVAPVLQLLIFGYAANLDVATSRVAVVDQDGTAESRALAARFAGSSSFERVATLGDASTAEAMLARGEADLALVVPAGFARSRDGAAVQLVVDGADSTSAQIGLSSALGLLRAIGAEAAARASAAGGAEPAPSVEVRTTVLYNPEFRSRWFMIPGVLALVLLVVTLIATSMAVVREKELGTFELLAVSPVSRATLLAGKLVPFAAFGLLDTALVLAVSTSWFGVPLRGSVLLLLLATFPFVLCTLGLGLLVSTISSTQQQAMMTGVFLVMLPLVYFSGFIFPVESMPRLVRPLTELDPLRHLLLVLRGVMLRGVGAAELWAPIAKLAAIGIGVFVAAAAAFRKRAA